MPQYFIHQGVRRSVAARECGLTDIPALIRELGKTRILANVPLDQLHSPKPFILRDHRYIRYTEYPTQVLRTTPPPIEVEPLGQPGQKKSTPLALVKLL